MTSLNPIGLQIASLVASSPLPISMDLIKDHCAVDGNDLDDLLERYLYAAIRWAENATHRTFYQRSHVWTLADFPYPDCRIRLPRGRCVSVDAITYFDVAGAEQTLAGPSSSPAGTGWLEDLTNEDGGVIAPAFNGVWPRAAQAVPAPVQIEFTAGWPADEVPDDLRHAILFAISDMMDTRGSADLTTFGANLTTRQSLVSSYCLHRWY